MKTPATITLTEMQDRDIASGKKIDLVVQRVVKFYTRSTDPLTAVELDVLNADGTFEQILVHESPEQIRSLLSK